MNGLFLPVEGDLSIFEFDEGGLLAHAYGLIGCEAVDFLRLGQRLMALVDDLGCLEPMAPPNPRATRLMQECYAAAGAPEGHPYGPGGSFQIRGGMVLVGVDHAGESIGIPVHELPDELRAQYHERTTANG